MRPTTQKAWLFQVERDNAYEDRQVAQSQERRVWVDERVYVWQMEVRQQLSSVANLRLGELKIKGSFDGSLTCAIELTGMRF